jgi:hypothetical protein
MVFDKLIITDYSPISSKGGSKRRRGSRKPTRKRSTRKHKRTNKSNTRRRYR